MKTAPECISCFFHDIQGALQSLRISEEAQKRFLKRCLRVLGEELSFERIPSVYITRLHRLLKEEFELENPFSRVREELNRLGIEIRGHLEREMEFLEPDAYLRRAVMWAIAGNHLDIRTAGAGYERGSEALLEEMKEIVEEGLWVDDVNALAEEVPGKDILLVHDNVGEIAIDALLIEAFRRLGAKSITSALRTAPMTSDATLEDGALVGIGRYADAVISSAPDTLGVIPEEMTDEMKKAIYECDLIVAKGQANFYSFDELKEEGRFTFFEGEGEGFPPVCFILRTKCLPVARKFGAEIPRINVCFLWKK